MSKVDCPYCFEGSYPLCCGDMFYSHLTEDYECCRNPEQIECETCKGTGQLEEDSIEYQLYIINKIL